MTRNRSTLAFAAWLAQLAMAAGALAAPELSIETIDYPPFGIHDGARATGIGVNILQEISKRTGIPMASRATFISRLPEIAKEQPALIASVTRTPERETMFRWVGKISDDRYCFVTLASGKPVESLDEARKLARIGVNQGGATESFLQHQGFKNLDEAMGSLGAVRKLFAHKIDAWFTTEAVAPYALKLEHHAKEEVRCSGDLAHPSYWVAASPKLSNEQFERIRSTFADLEKEGFVKARVDSYMR